MLATTADLPADVHDEWAYEMKWDGVRLLAYVDPSGVRLMTRNDREVSGTYAELDGLGAALGRRAVLDGEVVALDDQGRPDFGLLQQRMHVTSTAQVRTLRREVPVHFLAFDLLDLGGRSLLTDSYDERRERLDGLGLSGGAWQVPPAFLGDGSSALATSRAQGLEGVVAKRRASTYQPGRRSPDWIKVKNLRTQEVIVAGWKPGQGRRANGIGSLLVGVYTDEGLAFAGHVGSGFTERALADLSARLSRAEQRDSPYDLPVPREHTREARWVRPLIVGEVRFSEWTRDGRLRHPAWRGLRPDKDPRDVRREP